MEDALEGRDHGQRGQQVDRRGEQLEVAEALGVECKVGLATRAVRVVIISVGLLFAKGAGLGDFELLAPAIYLLAGLTVITTFQRIFHVRGALASTV